MKHQRACLWIAAVFSLFCTFRLTPAALSSPPSDTCRLWVQYRPGQKAAVRRMLLHMGAVFHYDLSDLESFVVCLPRACIGALSGNPLIADCWFASMMSASEPRLQA